MALIDYLFFCIVKSPPNQVKIISSAVYAGRFCCTLYFHFAPTDIEFRFIRLWLSLIVAVAVDSWPASVDLNYPQQETCSLVPLFQCLFLLRLSREVSWCIWMPPVPLVACKKTNESPGRASRRPRRSKTIGKIPGPYRSSFLVVSLKGLAQTHKNKNNISIWHFDWHHLNGYCLLRPLGEGRSSFHAAGSNFCRRFVLIFTLFFFPSLNFASLNRNLYSADRGRKVLNVCESIADRYTYTDGRTGSTHNETTAQCNYRCIRNMQA